MLLITTLFALLSFGGATRHDRGAGRPSTSSVRRTS